MKFRIVRCLLSASVLSCAGACTHLEVDRYDSSVPTGDDMVFWDEVTGKDVAVPLKNILDYVAGTYSEKPPEPQ